MAAETRRTVAVTGASGFIGTALVDALRRDGHQVLRLVRGAVDPLAGEVGWDPATGRIDAAALASADAVVHLAAESIDGRWTASKKRRIRDSRVSGTRLIAEALASLASPPEVLVSNSAVGFYGSDRGDERLDESSAPGTDYLSRVAVEWEAAAEPAASAGIRVLQPRLGMVLDVDGERWLECFPCSGSGRAAGWGVESSG